MRFWDQQHDARSETRRLLLAFAVATVVLVLAVHASLVLAWWLMALLLPVRLPFPAGFLVANVGVSLLLVLGGWWVETSNLRAGGVKLAKRIGARELRASLSHAEQRLANVVDELCIAAQMPRPQIMVLPRVDAINAFAAGWDEHDAVLAVTQGALDHLTREEMQGMVAHELSHLHEGDTRLKMRLAGMVFGLELVYNFGDDMRERGGLAWWFGSAVMLAGLAGWLTGQILKAAVSAPARIPRRRSRRAMDAQQRRSRRSASQGAWPAADGRAWRAARCTAQWLGAPQRAAHAVGRRRNHWPLGRRAGRAPCWPARLAPHVGRPGAPRLWPAHGAAAAHPGA